MNNALWGRISKSTHPRRKLPLYQLHVGPRNSPKLANDRWTCSCKDGAKYKNGWTKQWLSVPFILNQ